MVNCYCPTFYPAWYTDRKVIFLKQCEFYSCTCERPQYSHDLFSAEMWLNLLQRCSSHIQKRTV